ncbi:hypothetical protein [Alicyclobacillus ferrooxydans]|nr:hypothetical protein [Alicyclobacillus ferrooxydans]
MAPHPDALRVLVAIASFVIITGALVKVIREGIRVVHKYRHRDGNWPMSK